MTRAILNIILVIILSSFVVKDKRIDEYVSDISGKVIRRTLAAKKFSQLSKLGGSVVGYYKGDTLQCITSLLSRTNGFHSYWFFILNDSLVFVKETEVLYKIPNDESKYVQYVKKHTDKNGDIDLTKLPLEKDDYNVYYISDFHIIDFNMRSFGKPTKLFEDVIAAKNKEIIEHYLSHLEELKSTSASK